MFVFKPISSWYWVSWWYWFKDKHTESNILRVTINIVTRRMPFFYSMSPVTDLTLRVLSSEPQKILSLHSNESVYRIPIPKSTNPPPTEHWDCFQASQDHRRFLLFTETKMFTTASVPLRPPESTNSSTEHWDCFSRVQDFKRFPFFPQTNKLTTAPFHFTR